MLVSVLLGSVPGGGGEVISLGVVLEVEAGAGAGVSILNGAAFFWICLGTNIIWCAFLSTAWLPGDVLEYHAKDLTCIASRAKLLARVLSLPS